MGLSSTDTIRFHAAQGAKAPNHLSDPSNMYHLLTPRQKLYLVLPVYLC
jgi:hypothetical protein